MTTFEINGNAGSYKVNLPTKLNEITTQYLNEVTSNIDVAPDYSLIGLIYRDSLAMVLSAVKKNKAANMNVVPVFVRAGKTDSDFINNLRTNEPIIISGSDLAMGFHVSTPKNKITIDNIIHICDGDKAIYTSALAGKNNQVLFLEFKLVPNCAIHGAYQDDISMISGAKFVDPFITKVTNGESN